MANHSHTPDHSGGGAVFAKPTVMDAIGQLLAAILINIGEFGCWAIVTHGWTTLVCIVMTTSVSYIWSFLQTNCKLTKSLQWGQMKDACTCLYFHWKSLWLIVIGFKSFFCCIGNLFLIVVCFTLALLTCLTDPAAEEPVASREAREFAMKQKLREKEAERDAERSLRESILANLSQPAGPRPSPQSQGQNNMPPPYTPPKTTAYQQGYASVPHTPPMAQAPQQGYASAPPQQPPMTQAHHQGYASVHHTSPRPMRIDAHAQPSPSQHSRTHSVYEVTGMCTPERNSGGHVWRAPRNPFIDGASGSPAAPVNVATGMSHGESGQYHMPRRLDDSDGEVGKRPREDVTYEEALRVVQARHHPAARFSGAPGGYPYSGGGVDDYGH